MKNSNTHWSTFMLWIVTLLSIAFSIVTFVDARIQAKHTEQLGEMFKKERNRSYASSFPFNTPIHVRITNSDENKIETTGKVVTKITPYRAAILTWENSNGTFISIVRELECEKSQPEWFEKLLECNGGSFTQKEAGEPMQIHKPQWTPLEKG